MNIPVKISNLFERRLIDGSALSLQQRLAGKDASLWSDDQAIQQSILQRLGWMDCLDKMLGETAEIIKVKDKLVAKGFQHCVLLGMGGSSLAPELFSRLFSKQEQNSMTLEVVDNTSPDTIEYLHRSIDYKNTVFIVSSKSGTTIESDSLYRYFYQQVCQINSAKAGQHFVAITDPETALSKLAEEKEFFHCFINPADIGGRFSVLSFFGLVPAALLGINIEQLLISAKNELRSCMCEDEVSQATRLGMILGLSAEHGLDKLFIELSPELLPFAAWLEQLIAESTGKRSKGLVPVIRNTQGSNKKSKNNFQITVTDRLSDPMEQPVFSLSLDLLQIGAEFFKWEWATAIAGAVMNINPFDEPNVGENKNITVELLEATSGKSVNSLSTSSVDALNYGGIEDTEVLQNKLLNLIESAQPTNYLAVLIYAPNREKIESSYLSFKTKFEDKYKIPTTFGLGPRYLHSTGQLHKGGANNGVFLVVTTEFDHKVDIPGKAYGFTELNRAQAAGDVQALKSKNRTLLHVHLKTPGDQFLALFFDSLRKVIS